MEDKMPHENNKAEPGPMTVCTVAHDKKFVTCHFFEKNSADSVRCRYCAFDEYCISVKAYLDAKGVSLENLPEIINCNVQNKS
jgi:hypothetical protein